LNKIKLMTLNSTVVRVFLEWGSGISRYSKLGSGDDIASVITVLYEVCDNTIMADISSL
jgi:hypothetical protein